MKSLLHAVARFDDFLAKLEKGGLITLVTAMTLIVFAQVIYRYLLAHPISWSEELARYLFVWICLLGAALTVKRRGHFRLEVFYKMLPSKARRFLRFIIYILMGTVISVVLVHGIFLIRLTTEDSPAMEVSMRWVYASLPVGAALMAIHMLVIIIKEAENNSERS